MKNKINQRGITLIALIVTIVVLVILAAVAISEINSDGTGILGKANNAHNKADNLIQNTQEQHDAYVDYLEDELARRISRW